MSDKVMPDLKKAFFKNLSLNGAKVKEDIQRRESLLQHKLIQYQF